VISRAAQAALEGYAVNLLGTMFLNMMLGRFFGMFIGMQIVAVGDVGVMCALLMATASIMLGRLPVMSGRMFMMLCCFRMMFCALFAHRGRRGFGLTAGSTLPPAGNVYHNPIEISNFVVSNDTSVKERTAIEPGKPAKRYPVNQGGIASS
jgi:hypothetical protein